MCEIRVPMFGPFYGFKDVQTSVDKAYSMHKRSPRRNLIEIVKSKNRDYLGTC